MHENENVSRANREARRPLRLEICAWQRAMAGLFVLSLIFNAVLYGLLQYSEKALVENTEKLQAQLRQAERVRDDALRSYGALVRWVRQNSTTIENPATAAEQAADKPVEDGVYKYIGSCWITYYCPCELCCGQWADGLTATGVPAGPGIVAVDPEVIPLGSTVVIDGRIYLAADTGGAIKGLRVDVCTDTHAHALELGAHMAEVWIVTRRETGYYWFEREKRGEV